MFNASENIKGICDQSEFRIHIHNVQRKRKHIIVRSDFMLYFIISY